MSEQGTGAITSEWLRWAVIEAQNLRIVLPFAPAQRAADYIERMAEVVRVAIEVDEELTYPVVGVHEALNMKLSPCLEPLVELHQALQGKGDTQEEASSG